MEKIKKKWYDFADKHHGFAEFGMFFLISNLITVLQVILMPIMKIIFGFTNMINISFQFLPIGTKLDGTVYYVFDYLAGAPLDGGGGGLAYFLAVEITMLLAQIINFFLQKNVTFRSKVSNIKSATWYFVTWIIISVGSSTLQGLYERPIYNIVVRKVGTQLGAKYTDGITMLINCAILFWVFFPILKIIFKEDE